MNRRVLLCTFVAAILVLGNAVKAAGGVIDTLAGDGNEGFTGDGGPATEASLGNNPWSAAVDAASNVYVVDTGNHRIRKIDRRGLIQTVAGNGIAGFSGDGGAATAASLNGPFAVAVDSTGNIYIADTGNNRVRKVDTKGIISTIAGNDTFGFDGDGGPATSATLYGPQSVALDVLGRLYIADWGNNRVRLVSASGLISTVAGDGASWYNGDGQPAVSASLSVRAVAVDSAGNLYIADEQNNRIRKVDEEGLIRTVAGNGRSGFSGDGGPATEASLYSPYSVAISKSGDIFIADFNNDRIRMVNSAGVIDTVVGNGTVGFSGDGNAATAAEVSSLTGVAVDAAENIYIPDGTHRIRVVSSPTAPQ